MNNVDRSLTKPETQPTLAAKPKLIQRIMSGLPTILVLSTMGIGWMVMHHIKSQSSTTAEVTEAKAPVQAAESLAPAGDRQKL